MATLGEILMQAQQGQNMSPRIMPGQSPVVPPQTVSPVTPTQPPQQNQQGAPGNEGPLAKLRMMLEEDPAFKQAMLSFGAQLMQPVQPGQNSWGQVGNALMGSMDVLNQQRAQAAESARKNRALDLEEGALEEEGRQFDAEEELRNAEELLKTAQAGYYNRMPADKSGSGDKASKVQEAEALAKALVLSEKKAIADGRLPKGQARYTVDPNLAMVDAIERLNPNNATDPDAFEAKIREAVAPFMDVYSAEDKEAIENAITAGKKNIRGNLGSKFPGAVKIEQPPEGADEAALQQWYAGLPDGARFVDPGDGEVYIKGGGT